MSTSDEDGGQATAHSMHRRRSGGIVCCRSRFAR
jgi:hypothetical protein